MDVQLAVTILLISSTSKLTTSQHVHVPLQQDETGFSTNIVHQNPNHPDQQAESAINFRIGPNDYSQFDPQNERNTYNIAFLQTPPGSHQQGEYPVQFVDNPRSLQYPTAHPTNHQHSPPTPSQSFNVGYSVKFGAGTSALALKQPKQQQQQVFLNSDIITGTNKEEVMKPHHVDGAGEEYVFNSVLDSKKQKISGIKPKYRRPVTSNIDPEKLIAQANLSPKTQMKLQELHGGHGPNYENDPYLKKANNSPWKTLSPGVEIYQSKPIKTISTRPVEESQRFDHAKALGRSIGFDYSNVIDMKSFDANYGENTEVTKPQGNRGFNQYAQSSGNHDVTSNLIKAPVALPLTDNSYSANSEVKHATAQRQDVQLPQQQNPIEQDLSYTTNPEIANYHSTPAKFVNRPNFKNEYAFNQPQTIYGNPKSVTSQNVENHFDKRLENIYKFAQQNADPVFTGYSERLKQFYKQYAFPIPIADAGQNPAVQQYPNQQQVKTMQTRTPMYSVKENLQDDVNNNVKFHNKNFVYVPYNNFYGNNPGNSKKIRPQGTRYVKDTKQYLRPHARNKMHPRMGLY